METDIPDYDMDSEDEVWMSSQAGKLDLKPEKVYDLIGCDGKSNVKAQSGFTFVSDCSLRR